MKTRLLIIIGIITVLGIVGIAMTEIYQGQIEWKEKVGALKDTVPSDLNPKWITGEDYCHEWCNNDELYDHGCSKPILAHLTKYSNYLDEEFDGIFYLEYVGLPDGVSSEKFEECVDFIHEKRIIALYKDTPEVIAFYAKYTDAQVSLRDDHVSYFAGNEDDFRVRMNLEFDENYEIENIEFHCYVQREHQTEVPQTFILKFLKDWTCNEYGTQRNEN